MPSNPSPLRCIIVKSLSNGWQKLRGFKVMKKTHKIYSRTDLDTINQAFRTLDSLALMLFYSSTHLAHATTVEFQTLGTPKLKLTVPQQAAVLRTLYDCAAADLAQNRFVWSVKPQN
jgi:hypothetical protein